MKTSGWEKYKKITAMKRVSLTRSSSTFCMTASEHIMIFPCLWRYSHEKQALFVNDKGNLKKCSATNTFQWLPCYPISIVIPLSILPVHLSTFILDKIPNLLSMQSSLNTSSMLFFCRTPILEFYSSAVRIQTNPLQSDQVKANHDVRGVPGEASTGSPWCRESLASQTATLQTPVGMGG